MGDTRSLRVEPQGSIEFELENVELWSLENPHLYEMKMGYVSDNGARDSLSETFGVRTIAWTDEGFLLNGKRVIIQGARIHHDNGILGAATHADAEERRVRLMQKPAITLSVPRTTQFLRRCSMPAISWVCS